MRLRADAQPEVYTDWTKDMIRVAQRLTGYILTGCGATPRNLATCHASRGFSTVVMRVVADPIEQMVTKSRHPDAPIYHD